MKVSLYRDKLVKEDLIEYSSADATVTGTTNSGLTITVLPEVQMEMAFLWKSLGVSAGAATCVVTGKAIVVNLTAAAKTIGALKRL